MRLWAQKGGSGLLFPTHLPSREDEQALESAGSRLFVRQYSEADRCPGDRSARTFSRTFKECSSSAYHTCHSAPFTMSFRPSISMRISFNCCKNDSCNKPALELPPFLYDFNGLECPSCFALGASRCRNVDTMSCRGNEDHCYEISGTLMAGKSSWMYGRNWRSGEKSFCAAGPP
ncbi:hypothetical protein lerEdw1_015121, partial [Lerista edwardsae]